MSSHHPPQTSTTELEAKAWEVEFLSVPLFIYMRQKVSGTSFFNPQSYPLSLLDVIKGILGFLAVTLKRQSTSKYFFLMERDDLFRFYQRKTDESSVLIYRREPKSVQDFAVAGYPSFFFDALRGVCIRVAPLVFRKKYREALLQFKSLYPSIDLASEVRVAMGEVLYLKLLSKILNERAQIFYSGCVIPRAEKTARIFDSWEIQHGIITPDNTLYQPAPLKMNGLIVYHQVYADLLAEMNYTGKVALEEFKYSAENCPESILYPTVIYTQPIPAFQEALAEALAKDAFGPDVFIQLHPRDDFEYPGPPERFVRAHVEQVGRGVFLNSTVIEEFILKSKPIFILELPGIEYEALLRIYKRFGNPDIRVIRSLSSL